MTDTPAHFGPSVKALPVLAGSDHRFFASAPKETRFDYGGGFGLPRNAAGRGLLTPQARSFFEDRGIDLSGNAKAKAKKSGFRLFGEGQADLAGESIPTSGYV